jgi:TrmH family RNA methyltransferase
MGRDSITCDADRAGSKPSTKEYQTGGANCKSGQERRDPVPSSGMPPSQEKRSVWQPPKPAKRSGRAADQARDRIRIVLVEPKGPRNVGSTARAMKNFGLERLVLVNPPPIDDPECLEMATNAHDVLRAATIVESLDAALEGAALVVGTTARPRHRLDTRTPADEAPAIVAAARAADVAILFGREAHGLTGAELGRCQRVLSIRTGDEHASLNVSQAVLVVAYELFRAAGAEGVVAASPPGRLLTHETRRLLEDELMRACDKVGATKSDTREAYRTSIERVLAAAPIQTRDARVLFALARHAQKLADPGDPGARPPRRPHPRRKRA